jgi:hypothetical protein
MSERKTGMLVLAIAFAVVLKAIGRYKIDCAKAEAIRKALRKKR